MPDESERQRKCCGTSCGSLSGEKRLSDSGTEIDLIAKEGDCVVFAEVKYRSSTSLGRPEEAVDQRKQRRICRAALYYLTTHGLLESPVRFDVIAVLGEEITHFEHAFEFQE